MHENEVHSWLCDQGRTDKNMTLVFDPKVLSGREVSRIALQGLAQFHYLILPDDMANNVEFLLTEIAEESNRKDRHWQEVVTEYLETFLTIVYRIAERRVSRTGSYDLVIEDVIRYLEERFSEKVSLVEVSKRYNLSSSELSKKFKQHAGMGFREYLIHRRIMAAQKLLEETDLKVAAVASKVGFDSLTTFNRDFRLLTGVTPAVYRTVSAGE
jgi:transcriptional regulator GlxA family with amidase domain